MAADSSLSFVQLLQSLLAHHSAGASKQSYIHYFLPERLRDAGSRPVPTVSSGHLHRQSRLQDMLFELRQTRQFDRANTLEMLLNRLYPGGSAHPQRHILLDRTGQQWESPLASKWQEDDSFWTLLLSLSKLESVDMTSLSLPTLQALRTGPSADGLHPAAIVLPCAAEFRFTDSALHRDGLSAQNPFHMLYPSSMFESGLPKASIVPVYIDNHSTGSTGTSKAHQGSPVDSDEIWNRTSHNEPFPTRLEIPSLPIQPTDIFHNFDIGRQKKRQKPNTDRISSPSPDSGYTTDSTAEAPNLWQRIVQDSEYHQRALFSWESLDPRCRQPDSIPENDADAIRRHSPKPPFLTEAGNAVFDAVYQSWLDHDWSYREHSLVVSEETLVEALLNAAVGIPSLFFQYNIRTSAFEAVNKERKIRVEGCGSKSLERLIDGFMTIGTHYCRLEYVCEVLVNNTGNHGITGVSFGTALKSYLLFLHQFARDLYEPHALPGTSGPPTKPRLLEIQQRLRIVGHVLEMLCRMCECSIWDARHSLGFHLPRGSGLLSVLYNAVSELEMMMPFGPKLAGDNVPRMVVRALFLTLLERSSQPYFSWLQKWLHNLDPITLTDPFGEFYIRFINPEEHEPDAAFTDGGRMFWTYEYQINPDHEPISFLDDDLKQLVYEAGKSSLILRRHCPGHPLFSVYEQVRLESTLSWILDDSQIQLAQHQVDQFVQAVESEIAIWESKAIRELELIDREDSARRERLKDQARRRLQAQADRQSAESAELRRKKRALQQTIEGYLRERQEYRQQQEKAQAQKEAESMLRRMKQEDEWRRLEEAERAAMLQEYEEKMKQLTAQIESVRQTRETSSNDDLGPSKLEELSSADAEAEPSAVNGQSETQAAAEPMSVDNSQSTDDQDISMADRTMSSIEPVEGATLSLEGVTRAAVLDAGLSKGTQTTALPPIEAPQAGTVAPQSAPASHTSPGQSHALIVESFQPQSAACTERLEASASSTSLLIDDPMSIDLSAISDLVLASGDLPQNPADQSSNELNPLGPFDTTLPWYLTEQRIPTSMTRQLLLGRQAEDERKTDSPVSQSTDNLFVSLTEVPHRDPLVMMERVLSNPEIGYLDTYSRSLIHYSIARQARMANRSLLSFLMFECDLETHCRVLKKWFLGGDEEVLERAKAICFSAERRASEPYGPLTTHWKRVREGLRDAARNGPRTPRMREIELDERIELVYEADGDFLTGDQDPIEWIKIHYAAPPPLDLILTRAMMSQYQRAFSFIMKVLRCKHEVDNLLHRVRDLRHRADPAARDLTTKLLRLRHEAMVFSNGLLRYVMEVGVEVPWAQFASKLGAIKMSSMAAAQGKSHPDSPAAKAVQGLRDLYQLHEDYIADIHWRLFLAERQKPILTLIESLLDCVHALARECEAQTTHNQIQNWHDEFQTRMRMMVGILKKMGARASSRESECFVILKTYLDCNQFWG